MEVREIFFVNVVRGGPPAVGAGLGLETGILDRSKLAKRLCLGEEGGYLALRSEGYSDLILEEI